MLLITEVAYSHHFVYCSIWDAVSYLVELTMRSEFYLNEALIFKKLATAAAEVIAARYKPTLAKLLEVS